VLLARRMRAACTNLVLSGTRTRLAHSQSGIRTRSARMRRAMCGRLPVGEGFLDGGATLVGAAMCPAGWCGATWPLALMLSADQVPVKSTHSGDALARVGCPDPRCGHLVGRRADRGRQSSRAELQRPGSLPAAQENRLDEEQRLAAARLEWEAEAEARLARTRCRWQAEENERWSAREAELTARYQADLAAAETRYRQQVVDRIAAAEARWSARLATIGARSRANTEHVPHYRKCAECDCLRRLVIGLVWLLGDQLHCAPWPSRKSLAAVAPLRAMQRAVAFKLAASSANGMARPCSSPVRRRVLQGVSNTRSTSHVTQISALRHRDDWH
jgi:hypothetical protein